jgi:hypothetical protein
VNATLPYVLSWLAVFAAALAAPLLLVLPVTPLLDRRTDWRRRRATRVAVPVTRDHVAHDYLVTQALGRGVRLAVA